MNPAVNLVKQVSGQVTPGVNAITHYLYNTNDQRKSSRKITSLRRRVNIWLEEGAQNGDVIRTIGKNTVSGRPCSVWMCAELAKKQGLKHIPQGTKAPTDLNGNFARIRAVLGYMIANDFYFARDFETLESAVERLYGYIKVSVCKEARELRDCKLYEKNGKRNVKEVLQGHLGILEDNPVILGMRSKDSK